MFRRRALRRRLESAGAAPETLDDVSLTAVKRAADAGDGASGCARGPACLRLAALRVWRWPQLRDASELRRLPLCREELCCNPWHWSRLCKPDCPPPDTLSPPPPPPYSRIDPSPAAPRTAARLARTESMESPPAPPPLPPTSLATDGDGWAHEWCRLAYWEQRERVGRQVRVEAGAVHVHGGAGGSGGVLLPPPAPPSPPAAPHVRRARDKIGLGVTLAREADGVWLYNRSDAPVFAGSAAAPVSRVPPGHCLRVHPARPHAARRQPAAHGPADPRSVRISFAKGWGPRYRRQDVTACPCWLEVMLAPAPAS